MVKSTEGKTYYTLVCTLWGHLIEGSGEPYGVCPWCKANMILAWTTQSPKVNTVGSNIVPYMARLVENVEGFLTLCIDKLADSGLGNPQGWDTGIVVSSLIREQVVLSKRNSILKLSSGDELDIDFIDMEGGIWGVELSKRTQQALPTDWTGIVPA